MKKTFGGLALALTTAILVSACTHRETRIVQPAVVAPAPAGTTVIVPERNPDIIVDVD
ncbi:MAG: hypothetical protein AB7E79_05345 [Rhodospirillaceae bacterium]